MTRALVLVLALATVSPTAATANRAISVCADYQTQADAQRAADTLDADHDGLYCEALPCPCLGADDAEAPPTKSAKPDVGPTVTLAKVRRRAHCRVRHARPDRRCTPGAYYAKADIDPVCTPGFSSRSGRVSRSAKAAVLRAYGVRGSDRSKRRIDHLVPLELGGSNARANLFPQTAIRSRRKDRLEHALRDRVCAGQMRLRTAQRLIARDWTKAYRRYVA